MYSAQVLEHFQNPRNAGDISDSDAQAEMENPVCGDVIRLTLKLQGQRIAEARFKAKGCVASIACSSAVVEWIEGKTLAEAQSVTPADISAALGGLPPASSHAAQLAIDTLHKALQNLKTARTGG